MKIEGHLNIIEQEVKSLRARLKDSVEVVRCKDCKWFDGENCCSKNGVVVWTGNWYCADGERREDAEIH